MLPWQWVFLQPALSRFRGFVFESSRSAFPDMRVCGDKRVLGLGIHPAKCAPVHRIILRLPSWHAIGSDFFFLASIRGLCRRNRIPTSACVALPSCRNSNHNKPPFFFVIAKLVWPEKKKTLFDQGKKRRHHAIGPITAPARGNRQREANEMRSRRPAVGL